MPDPAFVKPGVHLLDLVGGISVIRKIVKFNIKAKGGLLLLLRFFEWGETP